MTIFISKNENYTFLQNIFLAFLLANFSITLSKTISLSIVKEKTKYPTFARRLSKSTHGIKCHQRRKLKKPAKTSGGK